MLLVVIVYILSISRRAGNGQEAAIGSSKTTYEKGFEGQEAGGVEVGVSLCVV